MSEIATTEKQAIAELKRLADKYVKAQHDALTVYNNRRHELTPQAAAKAAQGFATAQAIVIDKALLLEGRPTQITQTLDLDQLWTKLQSLLPQHVDTTAVEEQDTRTLHAASS